MVLRAGLKDVKTAIALIDNKAEKGLVNARHRPNNNRGDKTAHLSVGITLFITPIDQDGAQLAAAPLGALHTWSVGHFVLRKPAATSRRQSLPSKAASAHPNAPPTSSAECEPPRGSHSASATGAKPSRQFSLRARIGSLTSLAVSYSTDSTRPTTTFEDEHYAKARSPSNFTSPLRLRVYCTRFAEAFLLVN